ncbi:MAG: extracellular solute-binding protein [Clostridia bacterium]|nr:extracellular solute-binding protein [Clostridia bacterium]
MRKNYFKPLISLVIAFLTVLLCFAPFASINVVKAEEITPNGEITVFSWEDYIEEGEDGANGVLEDFEKEYPNVKVNYYSFATNEEMYNELLKDPTAVDVICPSEYMILKMKNEGLIKPYAVPDNFKTYGSPYIKDVFEEIGLNTNDGKTYAVGYMWGTMGLIYNADKFTPEDFDSWTNLYQDKFYGKITIKDSLRDSYIMAIAIVYKDELLELKNQLENSQITEDAYKTQLFDLFNRTDAETVDKVEKALIQLKPHLYGFEVDAGKNDLLTGKIDVNFAWSGDAVYSMWEADNVGKNLRYVVPKEGSNVWFDGWVMTKHANENASRAFIDFMSRPDIAVRNMDYVGYTSCVAGAEVFEYVKDTFGTEGGEKTADLSYFFGNDADYTFKVSDGEDGYYRHLYAQYADEETILRCAVMDNFSDKDLERINEMWNKVKLITLPNYMLILMCVLIALVIVFAVLYKFREKIFKKQISEKKNKIRKGCKIVEIKEIK